MLAAVVVVGLALASLAPAHARSEGRSSFVVSDSGRVSIEIDIALPDVPELCNADLLVSEPRRAEMESKLSTCLERDFSTWLRLRAVRADGDRACHVAFERYELVRTADSGTLAIHGVADCGDDLRTLVIDWGLFASTSLDHVSIARIEVPHDEPKLAMFSKRASKVTVSLRRPLAPYLGAAALAVVIVASVVAVVVVRRRRGARAHSAG